MSAPRDLDRLLVSFLSEGPLELPDPSYDQVRDRMEHTRQRAFVGSWRTPDMNRYLKVGLAAAAVVVIAVVAINLLPGAPAPGGEPSVSPSVEPSVEPSSSVAAGLPEGPFLILPGGAGNPEDDTPPLTVTIPAPGWDGEVGILLKNWGESDGAGMTIFARQEYLVYGDPCHWASTIPDKAVTTVDEFVAALSSQPSRNASEPVDITVGGYTGKSIMLHIPDDADFSQCDEGTFASWNCDDAGSNPCGFHAGPGETDIEYILDVGGVLMAWHTGYAAGAPVDVVAELEAIVQSATFGN